MPRLRTMLNRAVGHFLNFTRLGQWIMAHRFKLLYRNAQNDYVRVVLSNYCRYVLSYPIMPMRSALFRHMCKELAELDGNPWGSGPPTFTRSHAEQLGWLEREEDWIEQKLALGNLSASEAARHLDRLERVRARIEELRLLRRETRAQGGCNDNNT